jgi:aspartate racemase
MKANGSGNGHRLPLGVLGGMGPLASAEFVKTIYEAVDGPEQLAPPVLLHSDPSMPDRTAAFLSGDSDALLARFTAALTALDRQGVSKIVVACITVHYLLPRLPAELRGRIVSLLDVIFDALRRSDARHLLLCTTGTRRMRLFESHPDWAALKDRLTMPDDEDQQVVHRTIYEIKQNGDVARLTDLVAALLRKYEVSSFVAGCTEIHFAAKRLSGPAAAGCIDPLLIIANDVARGRI